MKRDHRVASADPKESPEFRANRAGAKRGKKKNTEFSDERYRIDPISSVPDLAHM
jgi:hypothetical protein